VDKAVIYVKNGIPESSDPPSWLEDGRLSTIPEFYSYIKQVEEGIKNVPKSDYKRASFNVSYNTEYHYPNYIATYFSYSDTGAWSRVQYKISFMPFEEGKLEIDIGDYENQLAMWNNQNMLDYKIKVIRWEGDYSYENPGLSIPFSVKNGNVENGISEYDTSLSGIFKYKNTIPEIYSFIKKEEERIRNEYNGTYHSYLRVQYDTEYHYPKQIHSCIGHLFGKYEQWIFSLTPPEETE
jgi:hypothetical protein